MDSKHTEEGASGHPAGRETSGPSQAEEVLSELRRRAAAGDASARGALAAALHRLGRHCYKSGDNENAFKAVGEALTLIRAVAADRPASASSARTPILDLARSEAEGLAGRARASGCGPDIMARVQAEARVSINLKPSMALRLFRTGRHSNRLDWALSECGSVEGIDAFFQSEDAGYYVDWHPERVAFELLAGGDRCFHYGALNVGGLGAPRYGRYCFIDSRLPGAGVDYPVWLVEDSLTAQCFRNEEGVLEWERLKAGIAPAGMAGELAALKLGSEAVDLDALAERLCNDTEYIEALMLESLEPGTVQEIRSAIDVDLGDRALAAVFDGPTPAEELEFELHGQIRAEAAKREIPWVTAPEVHT